MKKTVVFTFILTTIIPLYTLGITYQEAGVSITRAKNFVDIIKPLASKTFRPGINPEIGGFSGICDLAQLNYKDPLILSTTDGVGTKLKISQELNIHDTIGIDLVAMNVNDLIVHGAEPLVFLDYFATGKLDIKIASEIVSGIVKACQLSNCALSGGETAQMPGIYKTDEYDLAGFAIGIVERDQLLPKCESMQPGDIVIGLSSSGIHSNGYSLVRTIIEKNKININDKPPFQTPYSTIGEALLAPTTLYVKPLLPLIKQQKIKGLAHITGGSFYGNIPRILPPHLGVELDMECWSIPEIFTWLCHKGSIDAHEMTRTFNCGIGMIAIVAPENVDTVIKQLQNEGQPAYIIGKVIPVIAQHNDQIIFSHSGASFD